MGVKLFILAGMVAITSSITISTNGNSPERKMMRGMMIDSQNGMNPKAEAQIHHRDKTNYEKSRKVNTNTAQLSLNERYRRLIPYMTFYYANELGSPSTEPYSTDNVEVQKVQLEENSVHMRNAKKVVPNRYIPRYQGNRLTKYNIASANPTAYTSYVPTNQHPLSHNNNPLYLEQSFMNGHTFGRHTNKHSPIGPSPSLVSQTQHFQPRKPQPNLYHGDNSPSIQYYVPENEQMKYKLVPYEQTSIRIPYNQSPNFHFQDRPKTQIPVPVLTNNNQVLYTKTRKTKPHPISYDDVVVQPPLNHIHSYPVTEDYYEHTPKPISYDTTAKFPETEGGFRPMLPTRNPVEHVAFVPSTTPISLMQVQVQEAAPQAVHTESPEPLYRPSFVHPEYYNHVEQPVSAHEDPKYSLKDSATLNDILLTLQKSKSIPQPITKDNVGFSIRTLLQVLNVLKATAPQYNEVGAPVLSTPKPFAANHKIVVDVSPKPEIQVTAPDTADTTGLNGENYLAPVNTPSQHLDDFRGSSQSFPLVLASEDDGGTPGRAGIDYPILTTIPETSFDCKTQRYKGFFADPDTKCQVWHYCDLNGGQASFLCPNGTIFSQAALTCDWWFNVQCDSTHQLYVLNERLYKYILPHSPKFPEDYSGPLVDKYLTLKFKEMEEQFKKNKKKTSGSSDDESSENEAESQLSSDEVPSTEVVPDDGSSSVANVQDGGGGSVANIAVSESSVVVDSPGNSGNVQHLQD